MKRRDFLRSGMTAGIGLTGFPYVNRNSYTLAAGEAQYSERAIRVVSEATVIDMLGEFYDEIGQRDGMALTELWLSKPGSFNAEDYRKYKDSGVNVFAYGAGSGSHAQMIRHLGRWNGLIDSNSQYIDRIDTPEKLDTINESGKLGILMTYQDSVHFRDVDDVDLFYGLGQRVSQITNNTANRLGCGFFIDDDTGLTEFGGDVITRMNQAGMGVDVSHCGDRTTLDALSASEKPVLLTHAPCRALNPGNARAKTDEAIKKMAAEGGVIGIPILRFMIRDREPVTVEHFIDHIDHVVNLVGIEHVGIGSDQPLDTQDVTPLAWRKGEIANAPPKYEFHTNEDFIFCIEGINHSKRIFDIADALIARNYTDEEIKLILGGNFGRALKEIL